MLQAGYPNVEVVAVDDRSTDRTGALIDAVPGSVRFVAKRSLFRVPFFGTALRITGQIPIDRAGGEKSQAALETAERVRPLLREMWRVLAPEGRLILVVPNRRGVWARLDKTPFGQGRPYSRRQLEALLIAFARSRIAH